jgi:hypothetical protein
MARLSSYHPRQPFEKCAQAFRFQFQCVEGYMLRLGCLGSRSRSAVSRCAVTRKATLRIRSETWSTDMPRDHRCTAHQETRTERTSAKRHLRRHRCFLCRETCTGPIVKTSWFLLWDEHASCGKHHSNPTSTKEAPRRSYGRTCLYSPSPC